jgi:drug/metabolite transporter (DMT)-like permease
LNSKAPGLVFGALCFIWGSTWLVIKIGLDFLPPFLFAGIRFATATVALLILTRIFSAKIPRNRSSWALMFFLGVFQISLPYGLVFWAEQYITSGLAAVLFATLPFFVVVFAHILSDEKLTKIKAMGVLCSFAGLVAIFWNDIVSLQTLVGHYSLLGGLAVVGSSASGGLANVVAKRHANEIDPASNVLIQSLTGTMALSAIGIFTEEGAMPLRFALTAIAAILYLGVVGSALAFVGLYWLLTKTSATNSSLITFITPMVALILGWVVLQEIPNPNMGMGAGLILAGVYLTIKPAGRYL